MAKAEHAARRTAAEHGQPFGLPLDMAPMEARSALAVKGEVAVRVEVGRLPLPRLHGKRGGA
jgi:hypothetical protein